MFCGEIIKIYKYFLVEKKKRVLSGTVVSHCIGRSSALGTRSLGVDANPSYNKDFN